MTLKIKMKVFEQFGVEYDWRTLYVGLSKDFIDFTELTNYAIKIMSIQPELDNRFINELAWGARDELKNEILMTMITEFGLIGLIEGLEHWNYELRKWRYCFLKHVVSTIKDNKEILEKVSEVYADFGYPVEMEDFVYYMPPKGDYDPNNHTDEENTRRMLSFLESFISKEESVVKLH